MHELRDPYLETQTPRRNLRLVPKREDKQMNTELSDHNYLLQLVANEIENRLMPLCVCDQCPPDNQHTAAIVKRAMDIVLEARTNA